MLWAPYRKPQVGKAPPKKKHQDGRRKKKKYPWPLQQREKSTPARAQHIFQTTYRSVRDAACGIGPLALKKKLKRKAKWLLPHNYKKRIAMHPLLGFHARLWPRSTSKRLPHQSTQIWSQDLRENAAVAPGRKLPAVQTT